MNERSSSTQVESLLLAACFDRCSSGGAKEVGAALRAVRCSSVRREACCPWEALGQRYTTLQTHASDFKLTETMQKSKTQKFLHREEIANFFNELILSIETLSGVNIQDIGKRLLLICGAKVFMPLKCDAHEISHKK